MTESSLSSRPKKHRLGRALRNILLVLLVLVLLAAGILYAMFHRELNTLRSLEQVGDAHLFTMDYTGDYALDDFLETGASSDAELVSYLTRQLLKGIPMNFDLPDLGCSTYSAQLEDGTPIFGRNFDMYDSPALLVTTRPENGYASISMVNLAYIGYSSEKLPTSLKNSIMTLAAPYVPLDGVNEKGLCVGVLLIDTEPTHQQTDKVDITTTSAIRMLLDKAATVEEAVALLEQYDMHASANSCYHFHIADAQGGSVVVEYVDHVMNVVESKAATNFLLTPGDYDFGAGQDRYATLMDTLHETGGILADSSAAMALLQSVSQQPQEGKRSSTQWSCVYDQSRATVDIVMNMDYDTVYSFSLN